MYRALAPNELVLVTVSRDLKIILVVPLGVKRQRKTALNHVCDLLVFPIPSCIYRGIPEAPPCQRAALDSTV